MRSEKWCAHFWTNWLVRGAGSLCVTYRIHCCSKGWFGGEICIKITSSPRVPQPNLPAEPPCWASHTGQAGRKSALVMLTFVYPELVRMVPPTPPSGEPFSFSKTRNHAAHISAYALFYLRAAWRKWIWTSVYLSSAAGSKAKFHFSTLGRLCSICSIIWNLLVK